MSDVEASPVGLCELKVDEFRELCQLHPGSVFAVLDACDEPRVPVKVQEMGHERAVSLYRGKAERDYWAFAPYLAQVDESLLNWIVENLWQDPWGFFFYAATNLADARKHLRRFLIVEDPEGAEWYFRFYDPRILKDYLQTCTCEECDTFFGPTMSFFVTGEEGELVRIESNQA